MSSKAKKPKEKVGGVSRKGTRKAIMKYWTSVMKDTKTKADRRDRAAKELFKIVSIMDRMANSRRKIAAMNRRSQVKEERRMKAGGKKAARKEHAAETATKSKWAGLIPKAQVLPFRGAK